MAEALILGICGYSGSGKTTLIEAVVPSLTAKQLRVAVVKHDAHMPQIDTPGKDSDRFFRAGADVILRSAGEVFVRRHGPGLPLGELVGTLAPTYDVVLVEGHKDSDLPLKWWLEGEDGAGPPPDCGGFAERLARDDDRVAAVQALVEGWLETREGGA